MPFEIVRNDITKMQVDAIVNAANESLLGGGGVDGAIHAAAGPELLAECETLGGCRTGQAKLTGGYRLPCKYVIHTPGPVWRGGNSGEQELLASCYRESLKLAAEHGCESVAFPLISSGVYGYPKDQALRVASDTILEFLADHDMNVYLVIYDRRSFLISSSLYANIRAFIDDSDIDEEYYELQEQRRRVWNRPSPEPPEFGVEPSPDSLKCEARSKARPSGALPSFLRKRKECEKEAETGIADEDISPERDFGIEAKSASTIPDDLEIYVKQLDEGFRDMLIRKIDEKKMTDAECYKRANIDRKLFNKIKNQTDYKPGKSTVLALAISLKLPMREIREMLKKAGYSLSGSSTFDRVVEYFILHGNYNIWEINEALFSFDQKLLGSGTYGA